MCGRFTITVPVQELVKRFKANAPEKYNPRYNAAPMQNLPVILDSEPGQIAMFRWGLIPHWAKEPKGFINARSETAGEKPAFRDAFAKRRCLVLADGFYEWKKTKPKIPYRFTMRDGGLFAFAGLWGEWQGESGILRTFTILTTNPNEIVKGLHDRMPVILKKQDEHKWLEKPDKSVLGSYPSDEMKSYRVSDMVNNIRNDSPEVIKTTSQTTLF